MCNASAINRLLSDILNILKYLKHFKKGTGFVNSTLLQIYVLEKLWFGELDS